MRIEAYHCNRTISSTLKSTATKIGEQRLIYLFIYILFEYFFAKDMQEQKQYSDMWQKCTVRCSNLFVTLHS